MSELLTRHRFTVEEYHRMGEAGILPEDNRLELIHGDIVMNILLVLIAGHVLAALWHNFVLQDNTLRRMALVKQGPRAGGR